MATGTLPTTLGYAHDPSAPPALPAAVSAWPLLVPNVIAIVVLFLPLHSSSPPIGPVADYARETFRTHGHAAGHFRWDALITGPFLLAIPLALWTARLSFAPRPRAIERIIAWSLTLASLLMTLLCLGYCVATGPGRFGPAVAATSVILACGASGVLLLWRVRRAWPAALLAMTAAWAANTTLTTFVVLSHAPWRFGIVLGLLVVAAQLIIGIVCVCRWRAAAATTALKPG